MTEPANTPAEPLTDPPVVEPGDDDDEAPDTSGEPDLGVLPDAVDDPAEAEAGAALDDDEDPGEAEADDPPAPV